MKNRRKRTPNRLLTDTLREIKNTRQPLYLHHDPLRPGGLFSGGPAGDRARHEKPAWTNIWMPSG